MQIFSATRKNLWCYDCTVKDCKKYTYCSSFFTSIEDEGSEEKTGDEAPEEVNEFRQIAVASPKHEPTVNRRENYTSPNPVESLAKALKSITIALPLPPESNLSIFDDPMLSENLKMGPKNDSNMSMMDEGTKKNVGKNIVEPNNEPILNELPVNAETRMEGKMKVIHDVYSTFEREDPADDEEEEEDMIGNCVVMSDGEKIYVSGCIRKKDTCKGYIEVCNFTFN